MDVLAAEDDLSIANLLQGELQATAYAMSGIARNTKGTEDSACRHEPDFAIIEIRPADGDIAVDLHRTTRAEVISSYWKEPRPVRDGSLGGRHDESHLCFSK